MNVLAKSRQSNLSLAKTIIRKSLNNIDAERWIEKILAILMAFLQVSSGRNTRGEMMDSHEELIKVFAEINDQEEMKALFQEIFTPREIDDFYLRWELLKDLYKGETQRSIAAKHRISLCKITRGSKILKNKNSIILKLLDKYYGVKK